MHRVSLGPDNDLSTLTGATAAVTAINVLSGENYWIDHVEINNTDDDAIGIGNYTTKSAINVTITHYKVYSANKGILVAADQRVAQEAGRAGRVTIAWSDLAAICRNFRNSGGIDVHGFNNYSHDFGGRTCGTNSGHGKKANRDGTQTPVILVESSVFDDDSVGLYGDLSGDPSIPGLPVQGYVFTDGLNVFERGSGQNEFVIDPSDPNKSPVSRPSAPYSYKKIPTARVKAYVQKNAGVNGANIVFPSSN